MCGQYVLTVDDRFGERFGVSDLPTTLAPQMKAYPSAVMPVVVTKDGTNALEMLKWGMGAYNSFNARAETLLEKPTFAKFFFTNRCLVPVNGFFENKKFFTLKDSKWFSLAGIYHDGEYTVITTEPNTLVSRYHHRMPVIIPLENEFDWLTTSANTAKEMLKPYSAKQMEVR